MNEKILYLFLDEAGNFDFSPKGTEYFVISALSKERLFCAYQELTELKYDLVERGTEIEYFHASEDKQHVRDKVFAIIERNLVGIRLDSLIVEKRKIVPTLRPVEKFYPRMLGYLLRYVLTCCPLGQYQEVIVFTDQIPVEKKRKAIEKAIKSELAKKLPAKARYRILHHDSKSNMDLQIVDYCNGAVYRIWAAGNERSYGVIRAAIKSEFNFCRRGNNVYY